MLEDGDYRRILDLGSEILSCRTTGEMMDATLHRIGRVIRSRSVLFSVTKSANWKWETLRSFRLDDDFSHLLKMRFKDDPGRPALLESRARRRGNILNSSGIWPMTGEPKGRYYHELCKPRGIRHAMAITIPAGEDHFGALVMHRSSDDGHFDSRDEQRARLLLPFLKSALDRTCLLQKQTWASWILERIMPDLPYQQVIALDADLRPLAALPTSSAMLGDILRDIRHPAAGQPPVAPDLAAICRRLLSDERERSAVMLVRAREGAQAFRVEIDKYSMGSEAILLLRVPAPHREGHRFGSMEGGGLTPQEKRVALQAASGATNAAISRSLRIAPSTVAHHLSAALRKTGRSARWQLQISSDLADKVQALPLSRRQKQILSVRLSGLSTDETATALSLTCVTVRNHMRNIYRGLGVSGFRGLLHHLGSGPIDMSVATSPLLNTCGVKHG